MKSVSFSSKAMKLEGVPQMVKTVKEIGAALSGTEKSAYNDRLKETVMKPAMVIRDEARDMAPVVTGKLRDAIFAGPLKERPGALVGVKGVAYAAMVEFGTSKAAASPYFRPALNATRPTYANMISGDLKKLIDDIAKGTAWHASGSGS